MVIAANCAGVADEIGPSPSDASLRGLDGVNLLLAGVLSGFGPYVAAFLAEQNWTQQHRLRPDGRWTRWVAESTARRCIARCHPVETNRGCARCRYGRSWRADYCSLAEFSIGVGSFGAPRDHRRVPGAGDCCHQPWCRWQRSTRRTTWTQSALRLDRRRSCGRSHGPHRLFFVVSRDILCRRRAGASAARGSWPHPVRRYPFRSCLVPPGSRRAGQTAENRATKFMEDARPAHIRRLRVLVSDGQRVDATTRRRSIRVQAPSRPSTKSSQ
jgi:hypothetical protein